jgi:hypothetical protein
MAKAVVLASRAMLSPSTTIRGRGADPFLLVVLEPFSDFEGALRSASTWGERAAMRPHDSSLGLQHPQVLADGDRGDPKSNCKIGDEHPAVLFSDPGDVLLALTREHLQVVARFHLTPILLRRCSLRRCPRALPRRNDCGFRQ